MKTKEDEVEIDLVRLFRALLRRIWAIILAAAICGGAALAYTALLVPPLYKARTLMYVNNTSLAIGDAKLSISQGDLVAANHLVDTYRVIMKTRTTLEDVIEKADLHYSYEQLARMIEAEPVEDTEVFYIEVTSSDPQEAEVIANTVAQVLPEKIASIVEGTSARIVDYAVKPARKASPSLTKNTMLGILAGTLLACGVIVILELMDDEIHSPDYLMETYDLPVLAVIPDLSSNAGSGYGYGYEKAAKRGNRHGK